MIRVWKDFETSVVQVQIDYQTKKQYMVVNVLKYRSNNLITLYHCTYSRLLDIVRVVIWNSMGLMRSTEFGP